MRSGDRSCHAWLSGPFWASLHKPNFKIPNAGTQKSDLLFIGLIVKDVGGSECWLSPPKMTFSDYRAEAEWLLSIQQRSLFNKLFLSHINTRLRPGAYGSHLTIKTEISCLFTPACFQQAGINEKWKLCFWLSFTVAESRPTLTETQKHARRHTEATLPCRSSATVIILPGIKLLRVKLWCALFNGCIIVMTTAAQHPSLTKADSTHSSTSERVESAFLQTQCTMFVGTHIWHI